MKRRSAIFLAFVWVLLLGAADAWYIQEFRVAEVHLNRALASLFAAPVSFGDLSIGRFGDVIVTDVRLMRPDNPTKLYGTIDEVRVTPRWLKLLTSFELEVQDIAVTNPTLVVKWRESDRTFDMPSPLRTGLETRTRAPGALPEIALKGLTLSLENPPDVVKRRQNLTFGNLSITLSPEGSDRWLYRFEVDVDHPILGRMNGFGRFSQDAFAIEVERKGLMVTPYLLGIVNDDVKKFLEQFDVTGDLTVTASVGPVPGGTAEAFSATVECHEMSARMRDWPQGVSKVRGRIEYSQGRLWTEGLTAEFETAPMLLHGALDLSGGRKIVDVSGEVVRLGINNGLASRLRKLPEPCPTVADQIESWDPDGTANVKFSLVQERNERREAGPIEPLIEVTFNGGMVVRYIGHVGKDGVRHGFAYPLKDLRGVIKFTDKVATFDRLTATNGTLAVEAHGSIDYEFGGDETYDVDVDARGLRLDERVSAALQGSSRELFNGLDAEGGADLAVAIKRKKNEPPGARVDITVDLGGVGLRPRQFPVELADARGRVIITDAGPIKIEKVTARRQGGSLTLGGIVPVSRRGPDLLSLDIGLEKFQVDATLVAALAELAPGAAEALAKLNPVGPIDGSLHVGAAPDGSISDLRGALRFDDLTLAPEDPAIRIDAIGGSLTLATNLVTINPGTTGKVAGERFAVQGTIHAEKGLALRVEAENFHVDRELMGEIEPLIPWIRKLEPRPELDGEMTLSMRITGTTAEPRYAAEIEFSGIDVLLAAVAGTRVTGLHGHFSLAESGGWAVRGLKAQVVIPDGPPDGVGESRPEHPPVLVAVTAGVYEPATTGGGKPSSPERMKLTGCEIRGLEITPALITLLPLSAELRASIEKLVPTGSLDLVMGSLEHNGDELRVRESQLRASRLTLGAEKSIRADSFTINKLTLKAAGDVFDLGGNFFIRDSRFFDIPIVACDGKIAADGAGVRFEKIDGDLFGYEERNGQKLAFGKIYSETSRVEIIFADGSFDARLRLQDVNLPATMRVLGGDPGKVSGTYRCSIDLDGILNDVGSYRGRGDLSVRARNVVSLPVFYKMFNSLDVLSLFERKDPWTNVEIDFLVKDRVLDMRRMRIDSPDVLLEGPATLTFGGIIKADLKSNQGMTISPIGWVTRMISHAVFAGVRIEGPISDPRVNAYGVAGG